MSKSRRQRSRQRKLKPLIVAAAVIAAVTALGGTAYLVTRKSPEDHLRAAIALEQKGDGKAAAIELKNVLQSEPGHAEARYRLGRIHYDSQEYQNAEKELRRARDGQYAPALTLPLLARTLIALGKPDALLADITTPADGRPEDKAVILALRATAQLMSGKAAEAAQSLAEAAALQPDHPDVLVARAQTALVGKDRAAALGLLDQALAKAPRRDDIWLLKADVLKALGDKAAAQSAYGQVLALKPHDLTARLALANLHLEAGRTDLAAAEVKAAAKSSPGHLLVRYYQALVDFRQGRHTEAQAQMLEVMKGAPDFLPGHLLSGAIQLAMKNRAAAISHLKRVVAEAPNHTYARKLLALAMMQSGQVENASQLLAGMPAENDLLGQTLLGSLALRQGDASEAERHFEKAVALAPENVNLLTNLARSRARGGDSEGAAAALGRAAELDTTGSGPELLLFATHMRAKRYAEAQQVVDKLERERPRDALPHNLRGVLAIARDDTTQARAHFAKALELDPGHLASAANLAHLDLRANDMAAARKRFEAVLRHQPKQPKAWLALAALAGREKKEADYLQYLTRARDSDPKLPEARDLLIKYWLAKGEASKALNEASDALNVTGRPEYLGVIGAAHLRQKDMGKALHAYNQWAEKSPGDANAHYRLGQVQQAAANARAAEAAFDKALAINPGHGGALLGKVAVLAGSKRIPEALELARAFQKRHPEEAAGHEAEAIALSANGQPAEAARHYQQAARLSKLGRHAAQAHAALVSAGQGQKADEYLAGWLASQPDDSLARHQLALSQLQRGLLAPAMKHYEALLKTNPKDLVALNNLAHLYGETRDKRALEVAAQALKLAPTTPSVLDTYGWVLTLAGQPDKGLPHLRQALQGQPDDPDIRWHLASALHRGGDAQGALAELDRLLASRKAFAQEAAARELMAQLRASQRP